MLNEMYIFGKLQQKIKCDSHTSRASVASTCFQTVLEQMQTGDDVWSLIRFDLKINNDWSNTWYHWHQPPGDIEPDSQLSLRKMNSDIMGLRVRIFTSISSHALTHTIAKMFVQKRCSINLRYSKLFVYKHCDMMEKTCVRGDSWTSRWSSARSISSLST